MIRMWTTHTRRCLALCACLCWLPPPAGSGSVQRLLVGSWKLVSTEEKLRDGRTRPYPDLGPGARGYLMYSADGHMCAMLMNPARPRWAHEEEYPTDAERIAAGSGFSGYCGTYRVDEKEQVIVHHPEASYYPNIIDTDQKRPYSLSGSRLTFSGSEAAGEVERWTIVWERVASH
jgi:hypothetical protein